MRSPKRARLGLWDYATTDSLTLRCPNRQDQTRSRWEIHPLWMLLASVDWNTPGGPLSRTFSPTRAPATVWLGARAMSLTASMAAVNGHRDFERAGFELLNVSASALSRRRSQKGLGSRVVFSEISHSDSKNVRASTWRYRVSKLAAQHCVKPGTLNGLPTEDWVKFEMDWKTK